MKAKSNLPVYDICSLTGTGSLRELLIAEPFSDYLQQHPNLYQAHGHSFYHMVMFTSGAGFHTIDFQHYPVKPGEVYFMVPGQVHSWSFEGNIDGYVVNFSDAVFQSFLAEPQYLNRFRFFSEEPTQQVVFLRKEDQQAVILILQQLVQELKQTNLMKLELARLLLLQLFILIERALPPSSHADRKNPSVLVLQQFRKLVHQYYQQYRLPKDYAAMLYVTPNYLNALCKDLLGKSAGEVIRERILLEAKRLLVNQDENIAGIGYSLGFSDNSYFSKFFRKYTGQSPEDFRKALQASTLNN